MRKPTSSAGADHLERRSDVTKLRRDSSDLKDFLIVEDENFDADRLRATLHIMFGYEISVRRAATLGNAIDGVIERKPDVLFLDDVLPPNENAMQTIPFLRKAGYEGPIIIVSGRADRVRSAQLKVAGAIDAIHKDNMDSVRLGEALSRVRQAVQVEKAAKVAGPRAREDDSEER